MKRTLHVPIDVPDGHVLTVRIFGSQGGQPPLVRGYVELTDGKLDLHARAELDPEVLTTAEDPTQVGVDLLRRLEGVIGVAKARGRPA